MVVAFDGGTWDIIKPLAEQGKMPTVKSLMGKGKWGYLKSTFPPLTCPAWFSFSTGKNPGKFGMFNFFTMVKGSYKVRVFDNNDLAGHRELWDILNENGITCAIINNPIAYPPKKVNKYMVAGFMAPSKKVEFTSPPGLKEKLDKIAGGYEIDSIHSERRTDDFVLESNLRVLEKRTKIFNFFMEESNLDFLLLVFTGTDRICHQLLNRLYSKDKKEVEETRLKLEQFFVKQDQALGEVMKRVRKDDYLFLFSDHGFGKRDKGFYINQWLIDNDYLVIRGKPFKRRVLEFIKSLPGYESARSLMQKLGVWEGLREKAKIAPDTSPKPIEGEGESIIGLIRQGRINWKRTKAIAIPDGIYLNTTDRPLGIVTKEERELIRDEIIEKLSRVKDSRTGRRIKIEATKPEDHYWGRFVDRAPDIMPVIENYEWGMIRNIPKRKEWVGDLKLAHHREEGMIIATGPGISKGKVDSAEIIDLAPTVLDLFGIPTPKDMDGKVLSLFSSENKVASKVSALF